MKRGVVGGGGVTVRHSEILLEKQWCPEDTIVSLLADTDAAMLFYSQMERRL